MSTCYLILAPKGKLNSIFKNKEWGLSSTTNPSHKKIWETLNKGSYIVILSRHKSSRNSRSSRNSSNEDFSKDYSIVGFAIVEETLEDITSKSEWGDKEGTESKYPLRMKFSHVNRLEKPIKAESYFSGLPRSFSIVKRTFPPDLEKYLSENWKKRDTFKLLNSILGAHLFEEELDSEVVNYVPPILLKPLISDETSSEEFEDLCLWALKLLGLTVEQLGYERPGEPVWDFEIKHERKKPVIVDVKSSRSYYLTADERRKLKDYATTKKEVERESVDFFLIALDFKKSSEAEAKLKELKDELGRDGIGWFFAIKYLDLLRLIPKQLKGELENPLDEIKELSVIK